MSQQSPRLSARALIYSDDCILLAKHKDDRGYWYVAPGGGVLKGESAEDGLKREVMEEIGAEISVGDVVAVREVASLPVDEPYLPPNFHQVELFFSCKLVSISEEPIAMDPNQIGHEWVRLTELQDKLIFPEAFKNNFARKQFDRIYYGMIR